MGYRHEQELELLKVGDLIKYRIGLKRGEEWPIGIITRTPKQTNNGDYEVYFGTKRQFCREMFMQLVEKRLDKRSLA